MERREREERDARALFSPPACFLSCACLRVRLVRGRRAHHLAESCPCVVSVCVVSLCAVGECCGRMLWENALGECSGRMLWDSRQKSADRKTSTQNGFRARKDGFAGMEAAISAIRVRRNRAYPAGRKRSVVSDRRDVLLADRQPASHACPSRHRRVDDGPLEGIAYPPTGPRPSPNWRSSCSSAEGAAESTTCVLLLGQDGTSMPAQPSQGEGADRAGTRRRDETR